MSRYTVTNLKKDIQEINQSLEKIGSEFRLETGGRNGYQAVDIATTDQINEDKGCPRKIEGYK